MEKDYTPLVELVRFFTPFGVHHFNQYRSLNNKEWEDAAYYKQDISDLQSGKLDKAVYEADKADTKAALDGKANVALIILQKTAKRL